ncbi:MAG: ComEC/Rec2 family competence protein, partial [Saprospiraceae bacterium]
SDYFEQFLSQDYTIEVIGEVAEFPVKKNSFQVKLNTTKIRVDSVWHSCSGQILFYFPSDSLSEEINYGDELFIQTRINKPNKNLNPKGFDYKKYLHFQNVHYTGRVVKNNWQIVNKYEKENLYSFSHRTRKKGLDLLRKHLPSENEFAVGSALILGDKKEMTEEVQNAYAETGATHVLAVSGLHVGIVYAIITFIFGFIKSRKKGFNAFRLILSLILIWSFALITGFSPSVIRAATMFSFLTIGDLFTREKNIYNTLAGSAFIILLVNPYLLFSIGFQLSYLAVISIIFFQPLIYKSWYVENKFGKFIWGLISVSLAAQIMTLPISLYYFHQFPTYFILSGLVVIPAAGIIMY